METIAYAARLSLSTRRNHPSRWFQLVKVRFSGLLASLRLLALRAALRLARSFLRPLLAAALRSDHQRGRETYFSRTMTNEPGRAAGRTTHPAFTVTLQPSPCRVVPSSRAVIGTDSADPPTARKTPPLASRLPH